MRADLRSQIKKVVPVGCLAVFFDLETEGERGVFVGGQTRPHHPAASSAPIRTSFHGEVISDPAGPRKARSAAPKTAQETRKRKKRRSVLPGFIAITVG